MKYFKKQASYILATTFVLALLAGCSDDNDPQKEDTPELITKVTLTFVPQGGGTPVIISANDPDGEGIKDLVIDGPINLSKDKEYVLTISLINGLAKPTDEAYDISAEVAEEGDEHQFFFGWTQDVFANPAGNGNIDTASDPVRYEGGENSKDENGRNLGLTTTWKTVVNATSGSEFHLILKHQPDLKSETSNATIGETDLDIVFPLAIQ